MEENPSPIELNWKKRWAASGGHSNLKMNIWWIYDEYMMNIWWIYDEYVAYGGFHVPPPTGCPLAGGPWMNYVKAKNASG